MTLALLLIDLIPLKPGYPHYEFGAAEKEGKSAMIRVLGQAKASHIPIYALRYSPPMIERGCGPMMLDPLVYGYVPPHEVITKHHDDAFKTPGFSSQLCQRGLTELLLTGFNRDICVKASAKGAVDHGFSVVTSEHLMFSDRSFRPYRYKSLAFFQKHTTFLASVEDVMAYLASVSPTGGGAKP